MTVAADRVLLSLAIDPFADAVARLQGDPPLDVASIHAPLRIEIDHAIARVTARRRAEILLAKGDPGQGKTHELMVLRERSFGRYFFVEIPPLKESAAVFQHILGHTVQSLRPRLAHVLWSALRRSARAACDEIGSARPKDALALTRALLGDRRFVETFRLLIADDDDTKRVLVAHARHFEPLATLDPDLSRVILSLVNAPSEASVFDWLRGAELPDDELALVGVRAPLDSESRAFAVLRGLAELAPVPLVLCFDQLESVSGLLGTDGTVALFTAVMELYQQLPVCVVVMCQTSVWAELRQIMPQAALDRIRELLPLALPTATDAEALVAARLAPIWHATSVEPPFAAYPFSASYFESYTRAVRPTLRRILHDCSAALETMQRRGTIGDPISLLAAPAITPIVTFSAETVFQREIRRATRAVRERPDLATPALRQERLRHMVAQLLEVVACGKRAVAGMKIVELDLPPKPRSGQRPPMMLVIEDAAHARRRRVILELYSDNASAAWRSLERLQARLDATQADAAVLIREEHAAISDGATKTRELVAALEPAGGLEWLAHAAVERLVAASLVLDAVAAAEVWLGDHAAERSQALAFLLDHERLADVLAPLFHRVMNPPVHRRKRRATAAT